MTLHYITLYYIIIHYVTLHFKVKVQSQSQSSKSKSNFKVEVKAQSQSHHVFLINHRWYLYKDCVECINSIDSIDSGSVPGLWCYQTRAGFDGGMKGFDSNPLMLQPVA